MAVIAALIASLVSAYVAKLKGRKLCMILAGLCYLLGAGLTAGAAATSAGLSMLIIGRCALGAGVGFGNSVSLSLILLPQALQHFGAC